MSDESVDAVYRRVLAEFAGSKVGQPATPAPASACALIRRRGGATEVLLVQRAPRLAFLGGYWTFPGGKLEEGEDHWRAAAREIHEETAITLDDAAPHRTAGRWITPDVSPIRFDVLYYLIELDAGIEPDHTHSGGELVDARWVSPDDAIANARDGRWLIPSPVMRVIREIAAGIDDTFVSRSEAQAAAENDGPRLWPLCSGVAICPVRTPTLPPATHTNCYIVGERRLVVIDPASPYDDERTELDAAIDTLTARGAKLEAIWLTHHHQDHVSGAEYLAGRTGAPIAAHPETAARLAGRVPVARSLRDGDVIELDGDPVRRLRAVFTPGHAPGHLCFLEETTGFVIAGDMVAGIGTILIDPSEGDMGKYLASLDRLAELSPRALLPAHGGAIIDAAGRLAEYTEHRLWRERKVLDALEAAGEATSSQLVARVYDDVPAFVHGLAERSLLSHLAKLVDDGRAERDGDSYRYTRSDS